MVVSEVLIGLLKGIYGRARPPGPLVATSGAAFPSGHAVAASSLPSPGHRPGSRRQAPRLVGSGLGPPERRSQRSRWHDLRESSARGQQPYHARSRPVPSPPAGRAARTSWPRPPAIPSAGSPPPAQRPGAASSTARPRRPPGEEPRSLPTTGLSKLADTAPWPVIDPAEKGHICAHDQPIRYKRPANDHHAEPGRGHECVGPSALVHPAIRGPEPPPGQPPAQLPHPANLARPCRRSRLSGCICRHLVTIIQAMSFSSPRPGGQGWAG